MLLRMGYLMALLFSVVSYIFERRVYQLCFDSFYVSPGMWKVSRDSHIYMRKFDLHLHHVVLVSSYIADNERLLYEIHFTMTTLTVLTNEHFTFLPFTSNIGLPQSDKTSLKCCHVYIFITRFNFSNNFFRIVLHF